MKSSEERFSELRRSLGSFGKISIVKTRPTLCAPYGDDLTEFGFVQVNWAPMIWQGDVPLPENHPLIKNAKVFSIGLSSVLSCLQLELKPGDKLLDMCAAPGIKSLYLQLVYGKRIELYVNDLSHNRLLRLRRLFEQFNMPQPIYSNQPGQSLLNKYAAGYFDAVLIDAPCSGEGTIFEGDESALSAWSQAKVKRLAQLQRKLIVTAQKLIKPSGQVVYSTCTLNEHENERAIKKAGIAVSLMVYNEPVHMKLATGHALRLLPSKEGIGFFVAKLM